MQTLWHTNEIAPICSNSSMAKKAFQWVSWQKVWFWCLHVRDPIFEEGWMTRAKQLYIKQLCSDGCNAPRMVALCHRLSMF